MQCCPQLEDVVNNFFKNKRKLPIYNDSFFLKKGSTIVIMFYNVPSIVCDEKSLLWSGSLNNGIRILLFPSCVTIFKKKMDKVWTGEHLYNLFL